MSGLLLLLLLESLALLFELLATQLVGQPLLVLDLELRVANGVALRGSERLFSAHSQLEPLEVNLVRRRRRRRRRGRERGELERRRRQCVEVVAAPEARVEESSELGTLVAHAVQANEALLLVVATDAEQLALGVSEALRVQQSDLVAKFDALVHARRPHQRHRGAAVRR